MQIRTKAIFGAVALLCITIFAIGYNYYTVSMYAKYVDSLSSVRLERAKLLFSGLSIIENVDELILHQTNEHSDDAHVTEMKRLDSLAIDFYSSLENFKTDSSIDKKYLKSILKLSQSYYIFGKRMLQSNTRHKYSQDSLEHFNNIQGKLSKGLEQIYSKADGALGNTIAVARGELQNTIHIQLAIAIAMMAFTLLMLVLTIKSLVRPLGTLSSFLLSYEAGNRTSRLKIKSKDEIGLVAGVVNKIFDALDKREHELGQAEKALRASEHRYQTVFDSVGDLIQIHDLDGCILDIDQATCDRLGYTYEELIEMNLRDLVAPESASGVEKRLPQLREEGHLSFEVEHIKRDGSFIFTEMNSRLLRFGGRDVVFSVGRDITERKQAEEKLAKYRENLETLVQERTKSLLLALEEQQKEAEERRKAEAAAKKALSELDHIFNTTADGMWVMDRDGHILKTNSAFETLSGLGIEEVVGRKCYEVFPGTNCNTECCSRAQILRDIKTATHEVEKIRFDGEKRYCLVSTTPFLGNNGEVTGIAGSFKDITERKELERLREDVERIMRHDLKTPLNGLIGLPQVMLEDENLTTNQVEYLHMIMDAAYRMLGQINLSLDLYKMETGSYEFSPNQVDLGELLDQLTCELNIFAKTNGVRLELTGNSLCIAKAEEMLSHTMFSNVLTNAVEASQVGETVTVRVANGEDVVVSVHNNGVVPEAVRKNFFEKYTTYGKTKGTGLGTYSAKLMAEVQGGSIGFETSEDAGTTVRVCLPKG